MSMDFGPIPVSQFKVQSRQIFEALGRGRRVLLSRYGRVVAAIEPATPDRHRTLLAAFAMDAPDAASSLSATDIAQGSMSDRVRMAEKDEPTLLTRHGKVFGVLRSAASADTTESDPAWREQQLAQFERDHPDATPEQFAAEVARLREQGDDDVVDVVWSQPPTALLPDPGGAGDQRMVSDALVIRGIALERSSRLDEARATFAGVIARFSDTDDSFIERRVARAMLELARLSAVAEDPAEAVDLSGRLVARLARTNDDVAELAESLGLARPMSTA